MKVDRASMACSLEVRAPFLDVELVEFLGRVPSRLKLRRFDTKHLLKRAMADVLPEGIATRAKKGFGVPVAEWIKGELREAAAGRALAGAPPPAGLFEPAAVQTLLSRAPVRAPRPPQAALDALRLPALAPALGGAARRRAVRELRHAPERA